MWNRFVCYSLMIASALGHAALPARAAAPEDVPVLASAGPGGRVHPLPDLPAPYAVEVDQRGRNLVLELLDRRGRVLRSHDTPGTELGPEPLLIDSDDAEATAVRVRPLRAASLAGEYGFRIIPALSAQDLDFLRTLRPLAERYVDAPASVAPAQLATLAVLGGRWRDWSRFWGAYAAYEWGNRQDALALLNFGTVDPELALLRDEITGRARVFTGEVRAAGELLESVEQAYRTRLQAGQARFRSAWILTLDDLCTVSVYLLRDDRLARCERQQAAAQATGDPALQGWAHMNMAMVLNSLGRSEARIEQLRAAIPAFVAADLPDFEANAHNGLVRALQAQGDLTGAKLALRDAEAALARSDQPRTLRRGVVLDHGAGLYLAAGDLDRARIYAENAQRAFEDAGAIELAGRAMARLREIHFERGDLDAVADLMNRWNGAHDADWGTHHLRIGFRFDALRLGCASGQDEACLRLVEALPGLLEHFDAATDRRFHLMQAARVLRDQGHWADAARLLATVEDMRDQLPDSPLEQARLLAERARTALAAGQQDAAAAFAAQAAAGLDVALSQLGSERLEPLARAGFHDILQIRVQAALARSAGGLQDAIDLVLAARSDASPAAATLEPDAGLDVLRDTLAAASMALMNLPATADRTRRSAAELAVAAASEALETAIDEHVDVAPVARHPRVGDLALAPDEVLLVYQIGDASGWVFAVTAQGQTVTAIPGRVELLPLVARARELLASPRRRSRTPLVQLGRLLLPELVQRYRRVYVLPDGPLHALPLAVVGVPDAADWTPLVARHDVAYLQSPARLLANRAGTAIDLDRGISLFADPDFGGRPAPPLLADVSRSWVDELEALPGTRAEAERIRAAFGGEVPVRTWLGDRATKGNLMQAAALDVGVLHLATHGVFVTDYSDISGIALAATPGARLGERLVTASDVRLLPAAPDLVVLNACETALGRHLRGTGHLSIARSFLLRGSRAVVATAWKISDGAAAALISDFYGALFADAGRDAVAALSGAQRRLLAGTSEREARRSRAHPHYWGAHVIYL